jgi:hypothetical protein
MIPTDHEYTVAAHAAAKVVWDTNAKNATAQVPDWDDVPLPAKRHYLEAVLPIVDAALAALPTRDLVSLAAERIGRAEITSMLTGADVREAINADLDLVKASLRE